MTITERDTGAALGLSPALALARQSPPRPLPARRTPDPSGAPRSPPPPRLPPALPRRCRRASPNSAQVRTAPPRSAPRPTNFFHLRKGSGSGPRRGEPRRNRPGSRGTGHPSAAGTAHGGGNLRMGVPAPPQPKPRPRTRRRSPGAALRCAARRPADARQGTARSGMGTGTGDPGRAPRLPLRRAVAAGPAPSRRGRRRPAPPAALPRDSGRTGPARGASGALFSFFPFIPG